MKFIVLASLVLLAASGSGSVTLQESNVTFKRALQSCTGALGSVSFALGHGRVATAPGVESDQSLPDSSAVISVVLQASNGAKSAKVSIDQRNRTVTAKNVRAEANRTVACILPD